jgi:hypothetical protein
LAGEELGMIKELGRNVARQSICAKFFWAVSYFFAIGLFWYEGFVSGKIMLEVACPCAVFGWLFNT